MRRLRALMGVVLILAIAGISPAQVTPQPSPPTLPEAANPSVETESADELNRRAFVHFERGKKRKKKEEFRKAIDSFQSAETLFSAAGSKMDAAWMYGWMGDCHRDSGNDKSAVTSYQECISRFAKLDDQRVRAEGISNNASELGKALYRLQRYQDAIPAFEQSAAAYAEIGQDESVNTAWTHSYRGDCLTELGNDEGAVTAYRVSIAIFKNHKHWSGLADDARDLAKALKRLKKYEDAVPVFELAAQAYEKTEKPADAAWMYGWMGDCHRDSGNDKSAVTSYQECISRFAKLDDKPSYATSLNNLAVLYKSMGDYVQAEPLYVQARDIMKKVLGEEHPDYATSLNCLASDGNGIPSSRR